MTRRAWIFIVAGLGIAAGIAWGVNQFAESKARTRAASRPGGPNVILIVADDLGWGDLSCQGGRVPTPNIDAIASRGIRFTDAYASAPVCSPSRAGLLTGRYQQRFGHEFNGEFSRRHTDGLPAPEKTLGDRMKERGYATGCIGKWHLGVGQAFHPTERGFDEFFGFLGGSHSYQDSAKNRGQIMRGVQKVDEREYLTDAFTREATDFVRRHRERPFFLYLAYNAVHSPMEAPGKYRREAEKYLPHEKRTYGGMILALDEQVGRLMETVEENGLANNTIIVFTSDNGGRPAVADNGGLSGGKHELSEGGIRVPLAMRWDGKIPARQASAEPVILLDLFATALAAAGGSPPGDGVDLMPLARGDTKSIERRLFWRQGEFAAVREGKWKWLKEGGKVALFDLASDVAEQRDLSAEEPGVLERLNAEWEKWSNGLAKPLWREPRRSGNDSDDE